MIRFFASGHQVTQFFRRAYLRALGAPDFESSIRRSRIRLIQIERIERQGFAFSHKDTAKRFSGLAARISVANVDDMKGLRK